MIIMLMLMLMLMLVLMLVLIITIIWPWICVWRIRVRTWNDRSVENWKESLVPGGAFALDCVMALESWFLVDYHYHHSGWYLLYIYFITSDTQNFHHCHQQPTSLSAWAMPLGINWSYSLVMVWLRMAIIIYHGLITNTHHNLSWFYYECSWAQNARSTPCFAKRSSMPHLIWV